MTRVQFAQSRLATSSRIGEPRVRPAPDARQDPRAVLLDRLAGAPPVAALPPPQVDREVVLGQGQPGLHVHHGAQHGAVALAVRDEPEAVHARPCRPGRPQAPAGSGDACSAEARTGEAGSPSAEVIPRARASASAACMTSMGAAAGPERERRRALVEEHQLAIGRGAPRGLGVAEQAGMRVDQVEDEELGHQDLGRDGRLVGGQADRRCVDEHLRL